MGHVISSFNDTILHTKSLYDCCVQLHFTTTSSIAYLPDMTPSTIRTRIFHYQQYQYHHPPFARPSLSISDASAIHICPSYQPTSWKYIRYFLDRECLGASSPDPMPHALVLITGCRTAFLCMVPRMTVTRYGYGWTDRCLASIVQAYLHLTKGRLIIRCLRDSR